MQPNPWDDHAEKYARFIEARQATAFDEGSMGSRLLDLLGNLNGAVALDAGCGGGLLAQELSARGAHVTGIDLSPRLIDLARSQDPNGAIDYRIGDLSQPHPDLEGRFDVIGSYLVLNDVEQYRGFATTLAAMAKPGGRVALLFNNPYSSVVREHVADYFATGTMGTYLGLWEQGIKARYYHRTLEDYLDAFLDAGLRLVKLADVPDTFSLDRTTSPESRFPRFMILAFEKP